LPLTPRARGFLFGKPRTVVERGGIGVDTAGSPMAHPQNIGGTPAERLPARSRPPSHESGCHSAAVPPPLCRGSAAVLPHRAFARFFFALLHALFECARDPLEVPPSRTLARWKNGLGRWPGGRVAPSRTLDIELWIAIFGSYSQQGFALSGDLALFAQPREKKHDERCRTPEMRRTSIALS